MRLRFDFKVEEAVLLAAISLAALIAVRILTRS